MGHRALIPVKHLSGVKTRLSRHLTLEQRSSLVLDMLHRVIDALHASQVLASIAVVSADEEVLTYARRWGAHGLTEGRPGHNQALTNAAQHLVNYNTDMLLTLSADLPLLRARDIQAMVEQSESYPVVLAPSRDGTGTNAMLARPPLIIPYVFGVNSLQHYIAQARAHNLSHTLYHSLGTELDIDTIEDLVIFQHYDYHEAIAK
ncbi:2-phospho-L-lactate guanylyltransferase [Ktedonospora formicarum]|uniref:Phosphoenolpyruvate guanylyltransferase n=1 Tax=Ktedonospora formicarum TaxID=2778364 RepID=A0A8J3HRJ6_9CHLR|nr:2-phospho-L-lactate guanylyltransferase [Ktedonospora formicarum]GHO42557.1 hypothetical protein KSX_07200 [Ktedonospora formicarum]